jgi:AcrR family transcriptional regulator
MNVSKISARRQKARGADYEAKRAEIMRVGATVFKDVGYDAATVDDIARGAELDRASFYYYFNGKKELFREMVGAATSHNVESAETIADLVMPPEEKLRALVVSLFQSYQRHYPYLFVYLQQDINRLVADQSAWSAEVLKLNERFNNAVVRIIREGREAGVFVSGGSDKIVAAGVLGMCNWSHRWFRPDGALSAAQIAEIFSDMILGGLVDRKA